VDAWSPPWSSRPGLGLLMTAVFESGIVLRPQRRHLGLDSWVALLIYALGVWGLLVVSG
jgi:hypothetical protein